MRVGCSFNLYKYESYSVSYWWGVDGCYGIIGQANGRSLLWYSKHMVTTYCMLDGSRYGSLFFTIETDCP